jgi:hypothetical protein
MSALGIFTSHLATPMPLFGPFRKLTNSCLHFFHLRIKSNPYLEVWFVFWQKVKWHKINSLNIGESIILNKKLHN